MNKIKLLRKKESIDFMFEKGQKKLFAKDAMINAIILRENDTIEIIVKKLKNEDINDCIIVDENNKFLGDIPIDKIIKIIAHSSINEPLTKILNIGYRREILYTTAIDHINKHNDFAYETTPIHNILKIIDKKKVTSIPVLCENKEVVGIITPSSLLNLLNKY